MWVDQPNDLNADELEVEKLVEAFGSKPSAVPVAAASTNPKKPKLVTIIDPKRSQAVSIGLGRFRYAMATTIHHIHHYHDHTTTDPLSHQPANLPSPPSR